ncbi:MAG: excinuclease ABC subunit UvrC [Polyangiaceae bacterium]
MIPQRVLDKLESLPVQPGCYVFRNADREVLYIGKAKSLRARVRSYFQEGSSDNRALLPLLLQSIDDLETIVVESEKEACILENLLIKEHRPRFNIKLKDDKEFPLLRLNTSVEWPRLEVVRKSTHDGSKYFGPYPSASNARKALHLVNRHFQLRTCTDTEMAARRRPCLQYQIKRCPAPCVYEVDGERYATQVKAVALFLDGRHDELTSELEAKMKESSRAMDFETAAVYRDQIRAVAAVQETQRLVGDRDIDQDVLGLHREGDLVELSLIYVRKGCVRDTASFSLTSVEIPDDEVIAAFLRQSYDTDAVNARLLPDEIIVPVLPEGVDGITELLSDKRGKKVTVLRPQRGKKVDLLELAQTNAEHAFKEKRRENEDIFERLAKVQQRLRLPRLPRRIECVDISHHAGDDAVGAVVALLDGKPNKAKYRVFRVRTARAGDDYAAMYEVLARRFKRGRDAKPLLAAEAPSAAWPATTTAPLMTEGAKVLRAAKRGKKAHAPTSVAATGEPPVQLVPPVAPVAPVAPRASAPSAMHASKPTEPSDALETEIEADEVLVDDLDVAFPEGEISLTPTPAATAEMSSTSGQSNDEPEPTHDPFRDEPSEANSGADTLATEAEGGGVWDLPDLLVVDGGRGQLRVALTAAKDLGLKGLPIVGLAKERETTKGENLVDRVYLPGQKNGIPLRPNSPALFFLARARDEAHRASNHAREKLAKARVLRSELDEITGIGPKLRNALLAKLGSVDGVKRASDADLLEITGITTKIVKAIRKRWPLDPKPNETADDS